jgi:hypothetical protein
MNLRAIAESDLKYILEDVNGAGTPFILIAPDGCEYPVIGTHQDIGYLLDEENSVPIQGRVITVTYRMSTLASQTDKKPDRSWRVRTTDLDGIEHLFCLVRYEPDRTLGIARLHLEIEIE